MANNKWKSKLLSSSFPLEYQAMKSLVKLGFSVDSEYTYHRKHENITKEFSVDIKTSGYSPFSNEKEITSSVNLLIECKYRDPSTSWVFLPDPNSDDFTPIILGHTIRAIDYFSYNFLPRNATVEFDEPMDFCIKGIEIKETNVYDSEIKHGLSQLQYAMPSLLHGEIQTALGGRYKEEVFPFYICPILLTTASLRITDDNFSIDLVQKSDNLDDFTKKVPVLITYCDTSSDFTEHCKSIFKKIDIYNPRIFDEISIFREKKGEYSFNLPKAILNSLKRGIENQFFTQYIVCNIEHFEELIKTIKKIIEESDLKATKD